MHLPWAVLVAGLAIGAVCDAAPVPVAESRFQVSLPPAIAPTTLLVQSPFGINTALRPDTPDLEARLAAMQLAGIKWGRQDFTWKRIERQPGQYDFSAYEQLVRRCREHGLQLFGDLTSQPEFH